MNRHVKIMIKIFLIEFFMISEISSQQINIGRIEQMPNMPLTYDLPNWRQIAIGYDSLVFDLNASGEYLPTIFINNNTINYPEHGSFGIHSYIGTAHPNNFETINVIPAVVGASLAGVDKTNQFGYNWVVMCEEYFNNRPEEDVYLNSPNASSGNDWWYDTMPNIFFYQLNYLFPEHGDFDHQFIRVADRWLEAIDTMGGSTTPWKKPLMNYRGWYLSSMTGNSSGVVEPEAAGAIAWLLYNAYVVTGNDKCRIGAEWAMEFLNSLDSNPSYELQLPYGAYIAARMNAELNTNYNIDKIINWCFDVGTLRSWGAIVGNWGGYDVNGLIGEVNGNNDYAFAMNTFEQIGALLPLVRYDDRYARAIGKWILNAANSARLFYRKYLPDLHQDNEDWSKQYDPNSYIAYEALRQEKWSSSPYATGDAVDGGWANTNLGLYGSSHVGILGAVIDTTNIEKILKLDLLKTDYYHNSYPSYLLYNPYSEAKNINYLLPAGNYDLYDAVTNTFISSGSAGTVNLIIEADSPLMIVEVPAGLEITYNLNKTLAGEVVIDFNSGITVQNNPPRIKSLASDIDPVITGNTAQIFCTAEDIDQDSLTYNWYFLNAVIIDGGKTVTWEAPDLSGSYPVTVVADDGSGGMDSSTITIQVVEEINHAPQIERLHAIPRKIDLGNSSEIECIVFDEDGDDLTYNWSSIYGSITGESSTISWTAPDNEGNFFITCLVSDGNDGQAIDSIGIVVRDFSNNQSGNLIVHMPFEGNANDISGNGHNGTVYGAQLANDRFGNSNSAYFFDGVDDYILIPNNPQLNFSEAISINFWMKVDEYFDREAYPISHGNWENRWKASITEQGLRWTVKTNDGIKDLDSETSLSVDEFINVTLYYSPDDFELYLNGELNAFSSMNGNILTTVHGLSIGQALPDNNSYNFKGVLDDIRIYDYGLSVKDIENLYELGTSADDYGKGSLQKTTNLNQNYPNPFNNQTNIKYSIKENSHVNLTIYDILGRKIKSLVNEYKKAGEYETYWNAIDDSGKNVASGLFLYKLKTIHNIQVRKLLMIK